MDDKNLRAYMAEMIGTFALVFISAGAICVTTLSGSPKDSVSTAVAAGLAAGFIYAAALAVTLPLSGGYLNPALALMLWVFKRLDGAKASGLIAVQILGAALAGMAVRFLFNAREDVLNASRLGTPHLNPEILYASGGLLVPVLKGIAIELVLAFILVFILFGAVFDPRVSRWAGAWATRLTALWLGLTLAAITIVGWAMTGGAVNPARWFGTVIWELTVESLAAQKPFTDHAVHWIGPIAGSLIAGWLYTTLILPPEEDQRVSLPAAASSGAAVGSTLIKARK
jgi:glycerol uptake facilitator protein